ncbi:MAG: ABC transporter permease [Clostridia bacterium]|nr:ABC transporter permease [Clostridia bacterium]
MGFLVGAIAQGLLWAVMAIGVYITYRILDIADLTAEGCFTLGAGITCKLITSGLDPFVSTFFALIGGLLAGLVTGLLHTKLKIPALLAGILTMTGLWSVNLRVMGKSNIPLLKETSIITILENTGLTKNNAAIVSGLVLTVVVILFLWWFFSTEIGYALRATGNNKHMIRANGVNTDNATILGIMIGNGLIALSASLVAQFNSFSDIQMGVGTIVIGLASVIIGEVVFGNRTILRSLIAVALGSVLYRIIIAVVLKLGLRSDDMKLISSILLAVALCFPTVRNAVTKNLKNSMKRGGSANA